MISWKRYAVVTAMVLASGAGKALAADDQKKLNTDEEMLNTLVQQSFKPVDLIQLDVKSCICTGDICTCGARTPKGNFASVTVPKSEVIK